MTDHEHSDTKTDKNSRPGSEGGVSQMKGEERMCHLILNLDEKGNFSVIDLQGSCKTTLESAPPLKRAYWLRRMSQEAKMKLEQADEAVNGDKAVPEST